MFDTGHDLALCSVAASMARQLGRHRSTMGSEQGAPVETGKE